MIKATVQTFNKQKGNGVNDICYIRFYRRGSFGILLSKTQESICRTSITIAMFYSNSCSDHPCT